MHFRCPWVWPQALFYTILNIYRDVLVLRGPQKLLGFLYRDCACAPLPSVRARMRVTPLVRQALWPCVTGGVRLHVCRPTRSADYGRAVRCAALFCDA